jgi:hypothetical protein
MDSLVELGALEALPLIRRDFELGTIDEQMRGHWAMVLEELGVAPEPGDPLIAESRRRYEEQRERMFPAELRANPEALGARQHASQERAAQQAATQRRKQDQARKQKSKRKAVAASRKANRKKRRRGL